MEQNGPFHSVLFWILYPEAILYLSLDPKFFDLGIPNPKSKLFANNKKSMENFVQCQVLVTTLKNSFGSAVE